MALCVLPASLCSPPPPQSAHWALSYMEAKTVSPGQAWGAASCRGGHKAPQFWGQVYHFFYFLVVRPWASHWPLRASVSSPANGGRVSGDRAFPEGSWEAAPAEGVGLTRGRRQQAQVVETLVSVQLPLLKQEVHRLGRGGLRLRDRTVSTEAGGNRRGQAGGHTHLGGQQQQQQQQAGAAWLGGGHSSGLPPPTSVWGRRAGARGSSWAHALLLGLLTVRAARPEEGSLAVRRRGWPAGCLATHQAPQSLRVPLRKWGPGGKEPFFVTGPAQHPAGWPPPRGGVGFSRPVAVPLA